MCKVAKLCVGSFVSYGCDIAREKFHQLKWSTFVRIVMSREITLSNPRRLNWRLICEATSCLCLVTVGFWGLLEFISSSFQLAGWLTGLRAVECLSELVSQFSRANSREA